MDNQQVLVHTGGMIIIWIQVFMTMYQIDSVELLDGRTCIVVYIICFEGSKPKNLNVTKGNLKVFLHGINQNSPK
jgi:hypothetical protein